MGDKYGVVKEGGWYRNELSWENLRLNGYFTTKIIRIQMYSFFLIFFIVDIVNRF